MNAVLTLSFSFFVAKRCVRALIPLVALSKTSAVDAVQREMAASSNAEAAALARVAAADAEHEVAAIMTELRAWLSSELVVVRCCEALEENAQAAAASADALLLVLEALRRHAHWRRHAHSVVQAAWYALNALLLKGANGEAAVEHGALELAVASLRDTTAGVTTVQVSLAIFHFLACPKHVVRAVKLGGVEVRFRLRIERRGLRR